MINQTSSIASNILFILLFLSTFISETKEININKDPTIYLTGSLEFCESGSSTITASGGATYTWVGVAGPATGPEYTTSAPGDATVTVTGADGCTKDSTVTFNQIDVIEINLANASMCDGIGDTIFIPENIIDAEWQDENQNVVSDTNFYVISIEGTFTVTGYSTVTGCEAFGTFSVENFISPTINILDSVEVCRSDSGIDSTFINFTALSSNSDNGTWYQVDIIQDFNLSDYSLDSVSFEGIITGCFPFIYITNTAIAPCMDTMATMIVCVNPCP